MFELFLPNFSSAANLFVSLTSWKNADKIRNKLNEMNIELIDHKEKTIWMKKEKIKSEK